MNAPQQPPRTALEQLLADEIARRADAQQHLADYAQQVVGVTPAAHHRYICDELERGILNDEWDDCVICMPPGSSKSTYVSQCLPAWFLGHFPANNVILASHTATLAEKWSRRVRDTVASPEHTRVFEHSTLSKDSTSVSKWNTSLNGEFLAAGVGMSILGFRADCLVGSTQVRTKTGYNCISEIHVGDEVLAYDESKLSAGYHRVLATKRRTTDITYRIHTTDGRVVEATGNHPFYSGGRFVPANTLVVGDPLMSCVWDAEDNSRIGVGEAFGSVEVGDGVLLKGLRQHLQPASGNEDLCGVRHSVPSAQEDGNVLLKGVLWKASANRAVTLLRHMWSGISSKVFGDGFPVLLDVLQEPCTQSANGGIQQSRMATWQEPEQISGWQRAKVQGSQKTGNADGQSGVRHLLQYGEPARSSCGYGLDQQRPDQRGDALSVVPHGTARRGSGETAETTVARVEVVRGDTDVWDIQVEGVANFFAEGILVHNCAILDDPVAGWEQAQSATQLEKIHNWFKADLKSRLKPKAKIITICQRTAAYDMAGYMMKEHAENPTRRLRTIVLPMLAGEDDPLGRAPGERLWPDWYTPEMVIDLQKDEFIWKTMWQQEPPSDSGSWVTTDDIQFRPSPLITPETPVYASSDLALSVNKGDYTVHFIMAVDSNGDWDIIEGKRGRVDSEQSSKDIIALAQTYSPREWLIDDDNASKVFMHLVATKARETGTPVQWKPMPMRGQDKETRAAALRGQFKRRKIFMPPDAPFTHWLTKELLVFPNAVGSGVDDGVDALALFGRRLSTISPMAVAAPKPVVKTIQDATLNELWEENERKAYYRKRL